MTEKNSVPNDYNELKLKKLLEKVSNPLTHRDIISEGALETLQITADGSCLIVLNIKSERKLQLNIEAQIRTIFAKNDVPVDKIKIKFIEKAAAKEIPTKIAPLPGAQSNQNQSKLPNIKKIIGIASGKGGVGKSTVALNLAVTLGNLGKKVGLLDADIYGPSIGKMVGIHGKADIDIQNDKIIPVNKFGIKIISFGFLIDEKQPVVWRGPMLGKAVEQFLFDVAWGDLDYLLIDLPPGTGDTHLSLAQLIETHGIIIVTTPQQVAKIDAERAISMFQQVNIPLIGIIENMVEFICPHCGKSSEIFGKGAGQQLANENHSLLLGSVPLSMAILQAADSGKPVASAKAAEDLSLVRAQKSYEKVSEEIIRLMSE